jgi:hypothetical protein
MSNNKSTGQGTSSKRMSAFAESAYAHATHESTPPRQSFLGNVTNKIIHGHGSNKSERRYEEMRDSRNDFRSQDYDLLYCPDSTVQVDGPTFASLGGSNNNNIVHAEFQPLAGASIVILIGTVIIRTKSDSVGNSHSHTIKMMEERRSIGCAIESMGGKWVHSLESGGDETITHAIWVGDDGEFVSSTTKNQTIWERFTKEALDKLSVCQSMDIRK